MMGHQDATETPATPTLREMRRRRVISMTELARAAGVATSTVLAIEEGHAVPRPATIRKLCQALGCAPDEIAWPGDPFAVTRRRRETKHE